MHNCEVHFTFFLLKFLQEFSHQKQRNIIIINQEFDKKTKRKFDILVQHSHTPLMCERVYPKIQNFFYLLSTTFKVNVCYHLLIDSRYVFCVSLTSINSNFPSFHTCMHSVTKILVALCLYHLMVIHLVKPTNNQHTET